jgi:hypothetical protein
MLNKNLIQNMFIVLVLSSAISCNCVEKSDGFEGVYSFHYGDVIDSLFVSVDGSYHRKILINNSIVFENTDKWSKLDKGVLFNNFLNYNSTSQFGTNENINKTNLINTYVAPYDVSCSKEMKFNDFLVLKN